MWRLLIFPEKINVVRARWIPENSYDAREIPRFA
jgi:hypothetical protein